MQESPPTCTNSLFFTADWRAAIEAHQLLEPWPEAYTSDPTRPEPTPPLTEREKTLALLHTEQVVPDLCAPSAARHDADERICDFDSNELLNIPCGFVLGSLLLHTTCICVCSLIYSPS